LAESTQLRSSNTNSRDATCIEILTDNCRGKKKKKRRKKIKYKKNGRKEAKHIMGVSKAVLL